MAFARRQAVAPATLDLNLLLAGSDRLLGRVPGEDIQLENRPRPTSGPFVAIRRSWNRWSSTCAETR